MVDIADNAGRASYYIYILDLLVLYLDVLERVCPLLMRCLPCLLLGSLGKLARVLESGQSPVPVS